MNTEERKVTNEMNQNLNLKSWPGQGGKYRNGNSNLNNLGKDVKACVIEASLQVSYCWGLHPFEKDQHAKLVW